MAVTEVMLRRNRQERELNRGRGEGERGRGGGGGYEDVLIILHLMVLKPMRTAITKNRK